jgi:hypothetical protein
MSKRVEQSRLTDTDEEILARVNALSNRKRGRRQAVTDAIKIQSPNWNDQQDEKKK